MWYETWSTEAIFLLNVGILLFVLYGWIFVLAILEWIVRNVR